MILYVSVLKAVVSSQRGNLSFVACFVKVRFGGIQECEVSLLSAWMPNVGKDGELV
jgi:hypothetical protein